MTRPYELLIFDWDGTLMDSEAHIVACMQAAMGELGTEILDRRTICNVIGLGMREAVQTLFPDRPDEAFITRFIAAYREHYFAPDAPQALFEGALETLEALRRDGYLLAIATGKGRRGLDRALAESGVGRLVHAHRCAEETASKPDPTMLREILTELAVAPEAAVMVGDTEYDLAMAARIGMPAIGVSYGVHEPERLWRHRPLTCLECIADLPPFLRNVRREGLTGVG